MNGVVCTGNVQCESNRCGPSSTCIAAVVPPAPGDVDGVGGVTINDAIAVARNVLGIPQPPGIVFNPAIDDINCDSVRNLDDAIHLARFVLGFPGVSVNACS
ncbi:hypothetical protein HYU22_04530 [Candidatus Woesearchaeota archaeon]|nr:hypothetical protein [Candidatus Woesearchaeota archaeon]